VIVSLINILGATMNPEDVHTRFRKAVHDVVDFRQRHFPSTVDNDPLCQAYFSREYFERKYITLDERLAVIERLLEDHEETEELIAELRETGLTYLDLEDLRYGFPEPEADNETTLDGE